jgi:hypothetical protein
VKRWVEFGVFCLVCAASPARAQATGQAWANVIINWLPTHRLAYELDLEPKAQLIVHDEQPRWANLEATPEVSYALSSWVSVLGQVAVEYQAQNDEVNSMSIAPRLGVQLHLLSHILGPPGSHGAENEPQPRRRADFGTLVRLEHEDTFYSTSAPAKTLWRVRERFEVTYPLNRKKVTDDGAVYATSDTELFMPIDEDVKGGIVSDVRVRTGFGYRKSFGWRYEALYIWNGGRNARTGAMAATSQVLDVRIKRVY